ncbi:LytR/AlgR family response regulator transcription factor [Trichococcus flocculiformis]|uniref:LytR/AlgR family response regulator transcription factor n=1 Tax=Trichococcus flocculiformis TaxID=82803 RepID=UPI002AAC2E03|nr:LytTR family DNA-binding domain-containing protein [Trichococcus flocculiformis]
MRVAIVDDDPLVRATLEEYISRLADESGMKVNTSAYSSGDQFLEGYKLIYDIIIFDIDMPGINGMDAAKKIREVDHNVTIIFVTNMAQYAINGYEVGAIDYIIKPISYYDFSTKFRRTIAKAAQQKDYFMMIDTEEGTRRIKISECVYIEVISHYLYFHNVDSVYRIRGSMKNKEEELKPYNFVRVHKSFLVNMKFVETIQNKEIIADGVRVPIGRGFKDAMMQEYIRYIRGEL